MLLLKVAPMKSYFYRLLVC